MQPVSYGRSKILCPIGLTWRISMFIGDATRNDGSCFQFQRRDKWRESVTIVNQSINLLKQPTLIHL